MYSRNTKNTVDGREYPFTLPERYGGSRFRPIKEPPTRVHTATAAPDIPAPTRHSPPVEPPRSEQRAEDAFEPETEILRTEEPDSPAEAEKETTVENPESTSQELSGGTRSVLGGLGMEDLLLIGLILLLSGEPNEESDLPALLALLLSYRGSSPENR